MGLFATTEEKKAKKQEKENKRFNKLIETYHLTDVDTKDYELIKSICESSISTDLMDLGVALSFNTKTEDQVKINRLNALQEQNWIIINQLGRLNKNIKELIEVNKRKE